MANLKIPSELAVGVNRLPWCAVCGKPCDAVETMQPSRSTEPSAYGYGGQVLFRAKCHGRMQVSHLNESDLLALPPGAVASFGVAFQDEAACRAVGQGMTAIAGNLLPPDSLPLGLETGIRSALEEPPVDLGDFSQYADDE